MEVAVPLALVALFLLWGLSMCMMHQGPQFQACGIIRYDAPDALSFAMEHLLRVDKVSKTDIENLLRHKRLKPKGREFIKYMLNYFESFERGREGFIYRCDLQR